MYSVLMCIRQWPRGRLGRLPGHEEGRRLITVDHLDGLATILKVRSFDRITHRTRVLMAIGGLWSDLLRSGARCPRSLF